jgi:SAM-dependent methyltransferase
LNKDFDKEQARERVREIALEHAERGDALGWFEALYAEANGDNSTIPWADLEPNRFFRTWAESTGLTGNGRTALVVGCGLGDDAKYLHDLGFKVTAFDISPTAVEWAKRLYGENDIRFEARDLFDPPRSWNFPRAGEAKTGGFDFVLEIYTIQPLPIDMRERVVDAISDFVGEGGTLVVVTRGRDDYEEPDELPWPMSRRDLSRFEACGLAQTDFVEMPADEEDEPPRFVVEFTRRPVC